jgi:hypothetical protein
MLCVTQFFPVTFALMSMGQFSISSMLASLRISCPQNADNGVDREDRFCYFLCLNAIRLFFVANLPAMARSSWRLTKQRRA